MRGKFSKYGGISLLNAILAGMAGTTAMTLFVHRFSGKTNKRMKVVKVLGTMLTNETRKNGDLADSKEVFVAGGTGHYTIGMMFSVSYFLLWKSEILKRNNRTTFLLGVISGLIGMGVWKFFFRVHPFPPKVPLNHYLPTIFVAHIIFAYGTAGTYSVLESLDSRSCWEDLNKNVTQITISSFLPRNLGSLFKI